MKIRVLFNDHTGLWLCHLVKTKIILIFRNNYVIMTNLYYMSKTIIPTTDSICCFINIEIIT